jgi:D-alanine--poly(phosphoribitol) ligase subunit 1
LPDAASVSGSTPAYVMFTSGSTGEPKGAVIRQEGLHYLMDWGRDVVGGGPGERFSALNPLHFDNSVFDFYCGLLNGAALVPVETARASNPLAWLKQLRRGEPTVMFAVPTLFLLLQQLDLLTPASLPGVHTFLFGGEGFPVDRLKEFQTRFSDRARLINVYGPTETTCICSSILVGPACFPEDDGLASLGRMHRGFDYAVLDADEHPVVPGAPGELWIGGPCVGLGYYRNAEESRRRFRQNPHHDDFRDIWYRTGDLVVEDARGLLWFRGRTDNQVKIRGHRIELEEIDLAVEGVAGVQRALTVVLPRPDGPQLAVAFVAARAMALDEILAACKRKLPAYMLPARIRQVEDLPRNANGKADRRAVAILLEAER